MINGSLRLFAAIGVTTVLCQGTLPLHAQSSGDVRVGHGGPPRGSVSFAKMAPETLDTVRKELLVHHENRDAWASLALGDFFADPRFSAEADLQAAVDYYDSAIAKGVPHAFLAKAELVKGTGAGAASESDVTSLLRQASARGLGKADLLLSRYTRDVDPQAAFELLERAARKGDSEAERELGESLLTGNWKSGPGVVEHPTTVDPAAGRAMLESSLSKGNLKAGISLLDHAYKVDEAVEGERLAGLVYVRAMHQLDEERIDELKERVRSGLIPREAWSRVASDFSRNAHVRSRMIAAREAGESPFEVPGFTFEPARVIAQERYRRAALEIQGKEMGDLVNLLGVPLATEMFAQGAIIAVGEGTLQIGFEFLPRWSAEGAATDYYLEILSGPNEGYLISIEEGWGFSETVPVPLGIQDAVVVGNTVALRRWRTLYSIFGELNSLGLKPGLSAHEADELILFDALTQQRRVLYFHEDLQRWTHSDGEPLLHDINVFPWEGFIVRRKEAAPLLLEVRGPAREGAAFAPIELGLNLLSVREQLEALRSEEESAATVTEARNVPVFSMVHNGWESRLRRVDYSWWEAFGIAPDDPVHIPENSALLLVNESENPPILLSF